MILYDLGHEDTGSHLIYALPSATVRAVARLWQVVTRDASVAAGADVACEPAVR